MKAQLKFSTAAVVVVLTAGTLNNAKAAVCTANTNVATSCSDLQLTNAGDITISAPATITDTGTGNSVTNNPGTTTSLTNLGTISNTGAIGFGIYNFGTLTTLNNSGTIRSTQWNGIWNSVGSGITRIGTLNNSGTIEGYFNAVNNHATIDTLTNAASGFITGTHGNGIYNDGLITTITNSGAITGTGGYGIENVGGTIQTLTNYGTITGTGSGIGIHNTGTITTLTNSGTITGGVSSEAIVNTGTITTLTNSGTITGGTGGGIVNDAIIGTLINSGAITANNVGIYNDTGVSIGTLTNSGTITTVGASAIYNKGTITTLTNRGTMTSTGGSGIENIVGGTITTLNNLQGASGALTYTGGLPTNYNIIITGANTFGKLSATSATGTTTFGIYAGSTITSRLYSSVLQGLSAGMIPGVKTGTYDGMTYTLTERVTTPGSELWDLSFIGGSTTNTQPSLAASAYALRGVYNLQTATINNGLNYDCTVFDTHGICISAGGRYTSADSPGTSGGSALVVASYNLTDHVRLGGYLDQNIANSTPTGIKLNNGSPLAGLFGVWNEHKSGEGLEVRVAAGYGDKDLTVTRSVIGLSEAGVGKSQLTSQAVSTTVSYGTALASNWMVSPYAGVRYTRIKAGRYTEGSSADVTAPLTYDALVQQSTTALAGVRFSGRASPKTLLTMSAGAEQDTNNVGNSYNASGVTGLTPITFNSNIQKTRVVANAGVYYDITNTQRIGLNAMYRQEAFQSTNTVTALVTYQVGL